MAKPAQPSSFGLRGIALLEGLSAERLEAIARECAWRNFEPGQRIISRDAADRDLYLIVDGEARGLAQVLRQLTFIGLDRVAGYAGPEAVKMWARDQGSLGTVPQIDVRDFAADRQGAFLLDVRGLTEWRDGRIVDAKLIPLPELLDRFEEVPKEGPIVVQCQSGSRSSIAASVLLSRGRRQVGNLADRQSLLDEGFDVGTHPRLPTA